MIEGKRGKGRKRINSLTMLMKVKHMGWDKMESTRSEWIERALTWPPTLER